MSRGSRAEFDEIWGRLSELDGTVRALEIVLIRHIANTDFALRHHAESLVESVDKVIAALPHVPPNEELLQSLARVRVQIRNIAEANARHLKDG